MKRATIKSWLIKLVFNSLRKTRRKPGVILFPIFLVICAVLVFATVASTTKKTSRQPVPPQQPKPVTSRLHTRLSLQPEADKMRRRLGKRFVVPGRELSVMTGTLAIGALQHTVHITRSQEEDGERIAIALDGGPASLTWSGAGGAVSAGRLAAGVQRSLIERIALDGPDQFVLAQLRGASYYTVAQMVAPAGAGDSEDYSGPLWDLVRIVEPPHGDWAKPQNEWRIYHINNATRLIDKILYREQGQDITVEMSGWANRGGEIAPSLIRWNRDGKVEMELSFNNVSHGPK